MGIYVSMYHLHLSLSHMGSWDPLCGLKCSVYSGILMWFTWVIVKTPELDYIVTRCLPLYKVVNKGRWVNEQTHGINISSLLRQWTTQFLLVAWQVATVPV